MPEETPKYEYPFGGGGSRGPKPFYQRITPEQLDRACAAAATGRISLEGALIRECLTTDDKVQQARKKGREAVDKWERGEELDDREEAALNFYRKTQLAIEQAQSLYLQHALGDDEVAYARAPDTRDAKGNVIKGKVKTANPRTADQALKILQISSKRFRVPQEEVAPEPVAAVAKLTEAEQAAFVRDYLAKRGLPYPEQDGYDPESAAPANERK